MTPLPFYALARSWGRVAAVVRLGLDVLGIVFLISVLTTVLVWASGCAAGFDAAGLRDWEALW